MARSSLTYQTQLADLREANDALAAENAWLRDFLFQDIQWPLDWKLTFVEGQLLTYLSLGDLRRHEQLETYLDELKRSAQIEAHNHVKVRIHQIRKKTPDWIVIQTLRARGYRLIKTKGLTDYLDREAAKLSIFARVG